MLLTFPDQRLTSRLHQLSRGDKERKNSLSYSLTSDKADRGDANSRTQQEGGHHSPSLSACRSPPHAGHVLP